MDVGNIMLSAISDGTFVARPGYFGDHATAEGHGDLFDRRGQAWLPIGCFLIRSGDRCVLVDAGMGPTESSAGDKDDPCRLFGGQLPVDLRAVGVERDEVTDVVCTHLHPDHVGWLFDLESRPSFPHATIWFGAGDWRYFIEGPTPPSSRTTSTKGSAATLPTPACGRSTGTPRSRRASRQSRRRATRLATYASWSPPTANGHSCSATRSPAQCSWTSRPGTPLATSTRSSPTAPASGSGVSSKARTSPAQVRTSQSSSSDAYLTAAGSAGGRDALPAQPLNWSRCSLDSKSHLIVDRQGIPPAVRLSAATTYDFAWRRPALCRRGSHPGIAPCGVESSRRLGRYRRGVEPAWAAGRLPPPQVPDDRPAFGQPRTSRPPWGRRARSQWPLRFDSRPWKPRF
jgi:Metallo-beta-lactamase superfamily